MVPTCWCFHDLCVTLCLSVGETCALLPAKKIGQKGQDEGDYNT